MKIIQEDTNFEESKRKLDMAYAKLKSDTEKIYSADEVDEILDKHFRNMVISISNEFLKLLTDQVRYLYKDKPQAALKFRKDLKYTFHFKKSNYFEN